MYVLTKASVLFPELIFFQRWTGWLNLWQELLATLSLSMAAISRHVGYLKADLNLHKQ